MDRLSLGEKIFGASGLLLFILSFMGLWAKVEVEGSGADLTQRFSAWDAYGILVKLALVLALVGGALVIAKAANVSMDIPWSNVYRAIGVIVAALMVLALVVGPDETGSGSLGGVSVEISRGLGLFIGALLGLAMAAGAWMHSESPATTAGTEPAL